MYSYYDFYSYKLTMCRGEAVVITSFFVVGAFLLPLQLTPFSGSSPTETSQNHHRYLVFDISHVLFPTLNCTITHAHQLRIRPPNLLFSTHRRNRRYGSHTNYTAASRRSSNTYTEFHTRLPVYKLHKQHQVPSIPRATAPNLIPEPALSKAPPQSGVSTTFTRRPLKQLLVRETNAEIQVLDMEATHGIWLFGRSSTAFGCLLERNH